MTISFAVKSVKKRTRSSAPKLPRNLSRASIVPYPTADKSESAVVLICFRSTSLRRQPLFWLLRYQPEQRNLHGSVLATRTRRRPIFGRDVGGLLKSAPRVVRDGTHTPDQLGGLLDRSTWKPQGRLEDFRRTAPAEPGIEFENQTAGIEPSDCPRCWIVDRLAIIQTTETCHRANNRPDRKAQADQHGKDSSGHHTEH